MASLFFSAGLENRTLEMMRYYPELGRIWSVQIGHWLASFGEFARAAEKFAPGDHITSVEPDVSDLHDRNRAVIGVRFARGGEWFYKPRQARQSRAWFALLAWINRQNFPNPFRIPRLISSAQDQWMEAVHQRPTLSYRAERDFWFRAGALLYLVHLLRGVDFHRGNLIGERNQPVLVDCETLLHPETALPRKIRRRELGLFRTGMLPLNADLCNIAALGRVTAEKTRPKRSSARLHVPAAATVDGFEAMHEFFCAKRSRLVVLFRFANRIGKAPCRLIHRPTAQYHSILAQSLSPVLLKNGGARSTFLRRACRSSHITAAVAWREAAALRDLDIPLFSGSAVKSVTLPSPGEMKRACQVISAALAQRSD